MVNNTAELIIQFHRGVDESAATGVVEGLGGTTRRRMRSDHPDQIMLLVKVSADDVERRAQEAARNPYVAMVEVNKDGFSVR